MPRSRLALALALSVSLAVPVALASCDSESSTSEPGTSQLQVVVSGLVLPQSASEYAEDIDGDGTQDNQIARLLTAFKPMLGTFDPAVTTNSYLEEGSVLWLMDVVGHDLSDDTDVDVYFYAGADPDADLGNNCDGSPTLAVAAGTSQSQILPGRIVGGDLEVGPGTVVVPLPIGSTGTPAEVTEVRVSGTVSATGIVDGQLTGAIRWTEIETKLLPALASAMDARYQDANTAQETLDMLENFDTDGNGAISAEDLVSSPTLSLAFAPDVDLDGDGDPDAFSVGIGFVAVPCTISK
jgi:hypothetical protein